MSSKAGSVLAGYPGTAAACRMDDKAWRLSASATTARATATAATRSGAMTVTMLMILSARCALMMLADLLHAARLAAAVNAAGSGRELPSHATVTVTL